jgi:hypothetical protein
MKKAPREIPFAAIEDEFELGSYWWSGKPIPAVRRDDGGGYSIRVIKTITVNSSNQSITYDYFQLAADGTVLAAPRGYARDYKPGRITGLDDAIKRHAAPETSAPRIESR